MNWMPTAELPTISFITFRAAREGGSYFFCGAPGHRHPWFGCRTPTGCLNALEPDPHHPASGRCRRQPDLRGEGLPRPERQIVDRTTVAARVLIAEMAIAALAPLRCRRLFFLRLIAQKEAAPPSHPSTPRRRLSLQWGVPGYHWRGPDGAYGTIISGLKSRSRAESESAVGLSISRVTRTTAARIPPFREGFAACQGCMESGTAIFDGIPIVRTRFRIAMAPRQGAPDQPIAVHCKNPRFPRAFCLDVTCTASLEPASNYAAGGRIRGLAQQRRSRAPKRCL